HCACHSKYVAENHTKRICTMFWMRTWFDSEDELAFFSSNGPECGGHLPLYSSVTAFLAHYLSAPSFAVFLVSFSSFLSEESDLTPCSLFALCLSSKLSAVILTFEA